MSGDAACGCFEPDVFGHTECRLAPPIPEDERADIGGDLADSEGATVPASGDLAECDGATVPVSYVEWRAGPSVEQRDDGAWAKANPGYPPERLGTSEAVHERARRRRRLRILRRTR